MTESVTPHEEAAGFHIFLRSNSQRVLCHNFTNRGAGGITAFDNYSAHQVALGKNAHQQPIPKHRYSSDVAFHHGARHLEHALLHGSAVGILILDEIVDRRHTAPPRGTSV